VRKLVFKRLKFPVLLMETVQDVYNRLLVFVTALHSALRCCNGNGRNHGI